MSYLMISLNVCRIIRNRIGDPKVDQFELAFHENKVGRFEIRMDNFLLMDDMHSLKHLTQVGIRLTCQSSGEKQHHTCFQ